MTHRESNMSATRPFAIVTGASTGIGFELAKRCVKEGYDLLIAADEADSIYVTGQTRSADFPVSAGGLTAADPDWRAPCL